MGSHVYKLKVTLKGTRPPIWRRILVSPGMTLAQLHRVLQMVMGWTDSHLHQFRVGDAYFGTNDPEFGMKRFSERGTRIQDVLRFPKSRMIYEYDFGDGWEHTVVLEGLISQAEVEQCPMVMAGERACPPEDVGGIGGFYHFLEAQADVGHPDNSDMVEWWGGGFDQNAYDIDAVNKTLRRGRGRARGDP